MIQCFNVTFLYSLSNVVDKHCQTAFFFFFLTATAAELLYVLSNAAVIIQS